jgi:hypothetical protein
MIRLLSCCFFLFLTACPKAPVDLSPDAVLQGAQQRAVPFAMRGKFSAKFTENGKTYPSLPGVMILHRPNRFRIAVSAPIGGPIFTSVSDGVGFAVHLHRENQMIFEPEAKNFMSGFIGEGGAALQSLTNVLMGGFSLEGLELIRTEEIESDLGPLFVFSGPFKPVLKIRFYPGGELARVETFDAAGVLLFSVAHESLVSVDGLRMPKVTVIENPALEVRLRLKFSDWSELAKIPEVFGLDAPDGVEVLDANTYGQRIRQQEAGVESPKD